MNTCYIVAAGDMFGSLPLIDKSDIVIAADAGYLHLEKMNIVPDITVGDFDSMGRIPSGKVIQHPVAKDDTDTMLAIKVGFEKGYTNFRIFGGTGGKRSDHTISNIQALEYIARQGGKGILIGERENYTVIKNNSLNFSQNSKGIISIFSVGCTSIGVTLKGLLYTLDNATVEPYFPIGASNHFIGKMATVTVNNGCLLVVWGGSIEETLI